MPTVVTRRGIRISTDPKKRLILVRAPFECKDLLKDVPGAAWNRALAAWTYPMSSLCADRLRATLENLLDYDIHTDDVFARLVDAAAQIRAATFRKTDENPPQPPVHKLPAWKHQARGFWFAYDLFRAGGGGALLAMDMGTGKSRTAIDLIQNFEDVKKVLILCPLSVVSVWPSEFEKHATVRHKVVRLREGVPVVQKAQVMAQYLDAPAAIPLVFVCNYDSAWRSPLSDLILSQTWDFVVLDESHKVKSHERDARLAKFVEALSPKAVRRLALTGTPLPHSPMDAFSQFRFLDPGIFGKFYSSFRARFAVLVDVGKKVDPQTGAPLLDPKTGKPVPAGKRIVGFRNELEFNRLFYSIAYRVGKEVLELPPAVHVEKRCELESSARTAYRSLEKEFYAELEAGEVTAANALTKLLRLQQMAGGWVKADDGSMVEVSKAKRNLLEDVLEDLADDEPVVVFCRFRSDLDAVHTVADRLGRQSLELSGRVNQLKEWQAEGAPPILAVQIQAGGVGISLVRARYCVYFSKGFNLGDYEQSLARVHRPGQGASVTYVHLVTSCTVDERVEKALRERKDVVEAILCQIQEGEGVDGGSDD